MPSSPSISTVGQAGAGRVLAGGHDFCSSPRLSPDGNGLVWLRGIIPTCRGTAPCSTSPSSAATVPSARAALIAGGASESIFQPEWSPDGAQLVFVSDRSGWWNLYGLDLATERRGRWRRWRPSSACRNGSLACRPMRSPDPIASSAHIQSRARAACAVASGAWDAEPDRHAVHRIRLGAGRGRPRRVSRRRPRSSASIVALELASAAAPS